jgi:L-ascorbate metabolism protein UlaG (beta-lactamase superfamily)
VGDGELAPAGAELRLRFFGHATVRIELDGVRILTDPFLRPKLGPLARHGPLPDPAEAAAEVVLISHGHRDHFDRESLAALPGAPLVIVPRGLAASARRVVRGEIVELIAGETWRGAGLVVHGIEARHWISPGAPRAAPMGFLVAGSSRVYFAGDTAKFDGLAGLRGAVDVALLPVGSWGPHRGPGHLGPGSAAEVVAMIRPAVAVPIHWATLYPRRLDRIWSKPLATPGEQFAEHVRTLAPGVDVRVLRPGEATSIGARSGTSTSKASGVADSEPWRPR